MATWREFEAAAPEFAARARALFEAQKHLTIATLRRDGSPRISGIECVIEDGDLWFGSMANAVKAFDLRRDPRFALHSGSDEPSSWQGDAKLAGVAEETINQGSEGSEPSHTFRLDLREVSTVGLDDARKMLVIEVWTPEKGVRTIKRA